MKYFIAMGIMAVVFVSLIVSFATGSITSDIKNQANSPTPAKVEPLVSPEPVVVQEQQTKDDVIVESPSKEQIFKKAFIEGCDTDGTTTRFCGCVYDQMRKTYSIEDMAYDGNNLTDAQIETKYTNEIIACL